MSDWGRHAKYSIKRQPRRKGAIPLYGEKEDTNRYFRCRFCGFICDIQRDGLGIGDGKSYPSFTDADGTTKYQPVATDGCRLCGSKNWK
jgi:hypothetical protein